MTYTPTVWHNGDVITAEKLNHMENGIANSVKKFYMVNNFVEATEEDMEVGSIIVQNDSDASALFVAIKYDSGGSDVAPGIRCIGLSDSSVSVVTFNYNEENGGYKLYTTPPLG